MPGIELAPSMLVFVSVALSESISHLQNLQIGNCDLVISAKSVAQVTATAAQHLRWGKRKASALHLPVFLVRLKTLSNFGHGKREKNNTIYKAC